MSKRVAAGRREGFFKCLVEGVAVAVAEDDGVVAGKLEVGEELVEGVFRVERVVERRKVSCSCTEFALLSISGENGVFGAVGRIQAGGGYLGQGG